jgi:pimeloyl-ACP methyl ester carboxylesterase
MSYLDFGDFARPVDVLFLHANGFNASTYRSIIAPLAHRFRILALDQRGHGSTTLDASSEAPRRWPDRRDDVLAFMAVLGLQRVVIGGHSLGGAVSVMAAAAAPDRCRHVCLFDPVILPPGRPHGDNTSPLAQGARRRRDLFPSREAVLNSYRGRGAFVTWPESILRDYVDGGFHALPGGEVRLACAPQWEAWGFAIQGHDPWDALKLCPQRVDLLRAEIGSTCHLDDPPSLDTSRIAISTIEGASHFLPMERPELVADTLAKAIQTTHQP